MLNKSNVQATCKLNTPRQPGQTRNSRRPLSEGLGPKTGLCLIQSTQACSQAPSPQQYAQVSTHIRPPWPQGSARFACSNHTQTHIGAAGHQAISVGNNHLYTRSSSLHSSSGELSSGHQYRSHNSHAESMLTPAARFKPATANKRTETCMGTGYMVQVVAAHRLYDKTTAATHS